MLTLNIGLTSPTGRNEHAHRGIRLALALAHLEEILVDWRVVTVKYVDPEGDLVHEHTLVAQVDFDRARRCERIIPFVRLAEKLDQDCIAVLNESTGEGQLIGPRAYAWGEFNENYFTCW